MITPEEIRLASYCLERARKCGAHKARITLNKSLMELVGTLDGRLDKVSHSLDRSLSLALFVDGRYGTFSVNRLEESVLDGFIARAVETVRMLAPDPFRDLPEVSRKAADALRGDELGLWDDSFRTLDAPTRRSLALEASLYERQKAAQEKDFVLLSEEAEYSDSCFDQLILDSDGLMARHKETSFEYGVEMTVEDKQGNRFSGYWWDAAPFRKDLHCADCCEKALLRAAAQIGPRSVPGGVYTMVVQSECAAKLVTPLLNALGGFALQQKNSFLDGSLGKKIFSDGFTLVDACRRKGLSGSRLFDSEGVATREIPIIENGTVRSYFLNTYIAAKLGMAPTIEDVTRPAILPFLSPALSSSADAATLGEQDILRACGEGILVTGFNGGNSNSSTGAFSYGIEGFYFKDGSIVHPVREMLITGHFIDLWNHLAAAGADARPCTSRQIPTLAFTQTKFNA